MEDYLIALRSRDNTPATLLRMDKEHEGQMIDGFRNDMREKIKGTRAPDRLVVFVYFHRFLWGSSPPFFQIILFLSTTLLTGMPGISLHMQWPLTSQSHGSFLKENNCCFFVTPHPHFLMSLT
jgi:hypothetical protein